MPIREDFPRGATNPYGWSKFMVEQILADVARAEPHWRIARLRYFNPVGAHESGLIGEDPSGIPNNLMPFIAQVATGQRSELQVFGGDWPTPDGTGVRDYIHVMDLAEGHLAALGRLALQPGLLTLNLGTGSGGRCWRWSAFERACGRKLPYRIVARRPGDIAACWADPRRPSASSAGARGATWPRCVPTCGVGSAIAPASVVTRGVRAPRGVTRAACPAPGAATTRSRARAR